MAGDNEQPAMTSRGVLVVTLIATLGCAKTVPLPPAAPEGQVVKDYSNIRVEDYVGPEECGGGHLEEPNAYVRMRFLLAMERILGR
jgi:hypothetical protein